MTDSSIHFSIETDNSDKRVQELRQEVAKLTAQLEKLDSKSNQRNMSARKRLNEEKRLKLALDQTNRELSDRLSLEQRMDKVNRRVSVGNRGYSASARLDSASGMDYKTFVSMRQELERLQKTPNTIPYYLEQERLENQQRTSIEKTTKAIRAKNLAYAAMTEQQRLNAARGAEAYLLGGGTHREAAVRFGSHAVRDIKNINELERSIRRTTEAARGLNTTYMGSDAVARFNRVLQVQRALERGATKEAVVQQYGSRAVGDVGNLMRMAEAVRNIRIEQERGVPATSRLTDEMIRQNQVMRQGHSLMRGMAGTMGMMWLTWGSLTPLLAGAGVGAAARGTLTVGKDIEYRLKMVEALGNDAVKLDSMMGAIQGSMRTPLEAAEGIQALTQAGFNANESLMALAPTLQLATLGEMSVADAALTASSAIATFNLEVSDAVRVGDVFAKGASVSNASVANIAESMKQAGSAASIYGVSLEDVTAQISLLAKRGILGSAAGTAVRNAMQELHAPTEKAKAIMQQLNIEAFDDGKPRDYIDVLKDLRGAYYSLDEQSRAAMIGGMFNVRSRRAIENYLQNFEELLELRGKIEDSDGFLFEANAKLLDTVEGSINRMQSVLQQSYVSAFNQLEPTIRSTVDTLREAFGSQEFISAITSMGRGIAGLTNFLAQNAQTIVLVAGGYAALRGALMATSVATNLLTVAQRNRQRADSAAQATQASSILTMGAYGQAVSQTATQVAFANAQKATNISRIGGVAMAITRLMPGLNILLTGLTVGVTLWNAFGGASRRAAMDVDTFASRIAPTTQLLKEYNEQRREQLRLNDLQDGSGSAIKALDMEAETASKMVESLGGSIAKIRGEIERTQEALDRGEYIEIGGEYRHAFDHLNFLNRELKNLEDTQAAYQQVADTNTRERQANEEINKRLAEQAARDEGRRNAETLRTTLEYQEERVKNHEKHLEALERLDKSFAAGNISAEAYRDATKELQKEVDKELKSQTFDTGGGGGSGGLEARVNTSNIRAEMQAQARLFKNERDFRVQLAKEEAEVGLITHEQYLERRSEADQTYLEKYQRVAAQARSQIMDQDKGSEDFKALQAERINIEVRKELALSAQQEQMESEQRLARQRSEARRLTVESETNLNRLRREFVQEQIDLQNKARLAEMDPISAAAQEARIRAEERYNQEIQKTLDKLEEMEKLQPGYSSTEDGKALAQTYLHQVAEQREAGEAAFQATVSQYEYQMTAIANVRRATAQLADTAIMTGQISGDAIVDAANRMSDAFAEFAATGKLSFRSLISDILANIAKMYASQGFQALLSVGLNMATGFFGGGLSQNFGGGSSSGIAIAPGANLSQMFAKGGAFGAGVQKFSRGGAFTNSVTRGTNVAPMAMFGEAGPEAIMPLTRMGDGSLGVRADMQAASGGGIIINTSVVVNVDGSGNAQSETNSNHELGRMLGAEIDERIIKATLPGGIIDNYSRRGRG